MKMKRPMGDLLAQLKTQIDFLTRSAQSFDAGEKNEAIRMAVGIRTLLHDSRTCKSLLGQLGRKNLKFYDTAIDIDPRELAPQTCLISIRVTIGQGACYLPRLDDLDPARRSRKVQFWHWWKKVVITDTLKNEFTREDLVLTLANQDGGAHVDPQLEENFVKLSRFNSMGWVAGGPGGERPFERPDFPSLRQITHEVLKALRDEFPKLFS